MRLRAKITFENEEMLIFHLSRKVRRAHCRFCNTVVEMAPPAVLAEIGGFSEREIFRMIELDSIDFTDDGRVLACCGCFARLCLTK